MATPTADENPERVVDLLGKANKAGYQKVLLKVEDLDKKKIDEFASSIRDRANKRDFTGEVVDLMDRPGKDLELTVPDSMTKEEICKEFLLLRDTPKKAWGRMVVLSVARSGQVQSSKCVACEQNGSGPFEHCFTLEAA